MSDLIKREDAIKAVEECLKLLARPRYTVKTAIEAIPSVDIPHNDDWEEYSNKLWKNAYERGKADGAMIYGNEHNCIMTIFGECSYAETGCGDCAVVEKVRKALSADRPQGEWVEQEDCWQCSECGDEYVLEVGVKPIDARMHYCPNCGARMKGADDETD